MATEIRLVRQLGMWYDDEQCLTSCPVLKCKLASGARWHAPREILKFVSSEMAGNSHFPIYFQESLSKNLSELTDKVFDMPKISNQGAITPPLLAPSASKFNSIRLKDQLLFLSMKNNYETSKTYDS